MVSKYCMRKPILAVLFFLALQLSVFAQQPKSVWMSSYTAETADKKHIFIMRSREDGEDYFIGDEYPRSGMYRNDGSNELLWATDWKSRIYLPNGGKYVVQLGRLEYSATYRETAFTFTDEDRILRIYRTKDLIAFPYLLPHSSNGYGINHLGGLAAGVKHDGAVMKVDRGSGYPVNSGAYFDDEKRTMRIETYHGDRYLFDYTTGEIISAERPSRNLALALFGAVLIAYCAFLIFAARRKWRETALGLAVAAVGMLLTSSVFLIPIFSILPFKSSPTPSTPDYPDFWTCCFLSVSMLPQWLLTSLNLMSPAVNNYHDYSTEANIYWLILFWLPCYVLFAFLTHFSILFLKSRPERFC